jgi:inner membrane protein
MLIGAALVIAVSDALRSTPLGGSVAVDGVLDEIAHLGTGVLILGALGPLVGVGFAVGVLAGSVLIDADHLPQYLGTNVITAGTPRPYPHSLLTVLLVGVVIAVAPRYRAVAGGVALGLLVHLVRDMAEPSSGVALLWPLSSRSFSMPYAFYLAAVGLMLLVGLGWLFRRNDGSHPSRMDAQRSTNPAET